MALNFKKFWAGLKIVAKATSTSDSLGDMEVSSSTSKLSFHNGTSNSPVVTESHTATLTNKTLTSPVINTGVSGTAIDTDGTLATASNTKVPSALAVKTYVDNSSGAVQTDVDDLITLSGVPANSTTLGTFTGTTIPDGSDNQEAFQALETSLEMVGTDLYFHIADPIDAHDASAISVAAIANLTATEAQAAFAEHQDDIDDLVTLSGVAANATDLGTFTGSIIPDNSDNKEAFQALETSVETKATGAASSTDNHIVRFDGTTGKVIQDGSPAVLSDAGALSGLTQLDSDNLRLDGNTISSTDTNGNVIVTPDGTGSFQSTKNAQFDALINFASTNDAATGSNVTLTAPTTKVIRLTNASLVSIDGIPSGTAARELILENATGTTVAINEDTGATAANRFYTGTTAGINLADKASLFLSYDATSSRWRVIGGSGAGTGSQTPDVFVQLDASELISTWATGDNATFLGGGTLAGTFVKETSSPLNGTASYKYTQAASSLDDYIASPVQSVPIRFRGNQATLVFPYLYDGTSSDIEPIVWDVTNSAKLTTSTNLLPSTGTNSTVYRANISIPSTCTQIRVGFQVKALNSGKILQFDDVQVTSDVTFYANVFETDSMVRVNTANGYGSTATKIRRFTTTLASIGSDIVYADSATNGASFTIQTPGIYNISFTDSQATTSSTSGISLNSASLTTAIEALTQSEVLAIGQIGSGSDENILVTSWQGYLNARDVVRPHSSGTNAVSSRAQFTISRVGKTSAAIITAPESFSTDTASLVYAGSGSYTPATLSNAPVGTFITHTVASGGNVRTQTNSAPTQTTSDMNTNGIRIFGRVFASTSTAASPAVVQIQIGKGFKGVSVKGYTATGKSNAAALDNTGLNGSNNLKGLSVKDYNELTGILTLDAALDPSGSSTNRTFSAEDGSTSATDVYIFIDASKSPALVGVPQVQPRFATISDVKAATTDGGTFTSGAYQTRTLNTLVDSTGIVTSLASNQFTLPAGEYYIEAKAPAFQVNSHKAKIRNITDSTDSLIGSVEAAGSADVIVNSSFISGTIVITAAKVFELQHRGTTTKSANGFGSNAGFGDSEVYSVVKITKVK